MTFLNRFVSDSAFWRFTSIFFFCYWIRYTQSHVPLWNSCPSNSLAWPQLIIREFGVTSFFLLTCFWNSFLGSDVPCSWSMSVSDSNSDLPLLCYSPEPLVMFPFLGSSPVLPEASLNLQSCQAFWPISSFYFQVVAMLPLSLHDTLISASCLILEHKQPRCCQQQQQWPDK